MTDDDLTAIREAERRRAAALTSDDFAALDELLADDLVHVHATGVVQDKAAMLHHSAHAIRFHEITRGDLTIRALAPDVAVMTGPLTNVVSRRGVDEPMTVCAFVTQIWRRTDGAWRIASFHATRQA